MRLYLKLAAIVLLAVAAQWGLKNGGATASDAWFAARCQLAHLTNDEALRNRLMDEARDRHYPLAAPSYVFAASLGVWGGPVGQNEQITDDPADSNSRCHCSEQ